MWEKTVTSFVNHAPLTSNTNTTKTNNTSTEHLSAAYYSRSTHTHDHTQAYNIPINTATTTTPPLHRMRCIWELFTLVASDPESRPLLLRSVRKAALHLRAVRWRSVSVHCSIFGARAALVVSLAVLQCWCRKGQKTRHKPPSCLVHLPARWAPWYMMDTCMLGMFDRQNILEEIQSK